MISRSSVLSTRLRLTGARPGSFSYGAGAFQEHRQRDWVDIWRSIRLVRTKPWLFFIGSVLGFILVMVGPSFLAKPLQVYQSTAKILITPNSTGSVDPGVRTWFVDESTIRVLLSSQDLLDVVIESVGSSKLTWLELRDRIKVEILSKGSTVSLIEVSVVGGKAEEVRVLAQVLSEKFIQYVQQLSAAEHDKTVAYLERERRNIEREMARSQKRLLKLGFFPAGSGRSDSVEETWVQLQARRNDLERESALAQAEVDQLGIAAAESSETMGLGASSGNAMLQDSVSKERIKLAELREVYTERSVQVQQQLQKLKKVESVQKVEFGRAVSARMKAAQNKSQKLSSLLAQTQARLKDLERKRPGPEKQFEYSNEDRQLSMWQESYLGLTRSLYNARALQQSSRREGAFTIVEKPQPGRLVAGQVISSSLGTQMAMAIPIGLIVGFALVMGSDYLSTSMRLEPRIEEALGLPIIGSIPNVPEDTSSSWDLMKQNLRRAKAPA